MNTNVIILMIICATLIALVSIVCDHLFERRTSDITDCLMSKKIIKVHRNYIVGFLGLAVVMLITSKYGGTEGVIFSYLSFGSTITSLVLSILAIFVTVQSSSDIYKQFGTINRVSTQIESSLTNLKKAESKLEDTSSDISCKMSSIVDEIGRMLDIRMKKTEDTLSEQIQKQNVSIQNAKTTTIKDIDTDSFLRRIPYSGLLALYACSKGVESGKKFMLSHLFMENERYMLGVIMTSKAMGLVNCSVETYGGNYMVKCLSSDMKSEKIYEIMEEVSSDYEADAKENTKEIDEYFAQR